MYPKLVALDTDWTIFSGWLNSNEWGKGPNATPLIQNNILKVTEWEVRDQSNYDLVCIMYADIPRIIQDIKKHGAKLAIVSRNTSKELCDRALWYFYAYDAHGNKRSLIDLVDFDEIYDEDKVNHFRKIKGWTNFHYSDMVLYDDEAINNTVEMILGVTFQVSRDQRGLTWDNYQDGLAMWRRNRGIHSPWRGLDVHLYPKRKLIGYSAMDLDTIKLLEAGGRRQDRTEGARWGYAMYVTDNPTIAKFFSEWIKKTTFGPQASTMVCAIYARDSDIFHRMNKIWMPNEKSHQIEVKTANAFQIAWSQEDRDRQVAVWGVQKPYILFARHENDNSPRRWSEMVVYGQVQENLILTVRMSDQELNHAIENLDSSHIGYTRKFKAWNITVPEETRQDFRQHGERYSLS